MLFACRGIAKGAKKVVFDAQLPSDEVGNELLSLDQVEEAGVNPYSDVLTLERYRELFGSTKHEFTGVDYVSYYEELIRQSGAEAEIIFANQAKAILNYADSVLTCDIHTRVRTKRILKANGAKLSAAWTIFLMRRLMGADITKNTACLALINPRRIGSSCFRAIAIR